MSCFLVSIPASDNFTVVIGSKHSARRTQSCLRLQVKKINEKKCRCLKIHLFAVCDALCVEIVHQASSLLRCIANCVSR